MPTETDKTKETVEAEETKEAKEISQQNVDEIVAAHKRRTALILYLLVLFMAAMIFVVFSMLSQNKKLTNTNASALERAQALQDENRKLDDSNRKLEEKNQKLEEENKRLKASNEELQAENETYSSQVEAAEQLEKDYEALQAQAGTLQTANDELQQTVGDKDKASDLLCKALAAQDAGDDAAFAEAVNALSAYEKVLSPEQTALYTRLLSTLEKPNHN